MKPTTRALIVAVAAARCGGRKVVEVLDCSDGSVPPLAQSEVERALQQSEGREVVLDRSPDERISLKTREDLFVGWDLVTGDYFAGAVQASEVMLFDSHDRSYYRFQIH